MINIYLSSGGFILLTGGEISKQQLINAIDEGLKWVTIEEKTINLEHITWLEDYKPSKEETGELNK